MKNLARAAALSLTTVLALATVSACGSSDDSSSAPTTTAPSSSSTDTGGDTGTESTAPGTDESSAASGDASALCSAFANFPSDVNTSDPNSVISAAKGYGDQIQAAGVPSDMSADAQRGLQDYIDLLENLDADKVAELQNLSDPSALFGDDEAAGQAFFQYLGTNCGDALSSAAPN